MLTEHVPTGWEEKCSRRLLSPNWEPFLRLSGQHRPPRLYLPGGNYFLVLEDYPEGPELQQDSSRHCFASAAMDSM